MVVAGALLAGVLVATTAGPSAAAPACVVREQVGSGANQSQGAPNGRAAVDADGSRVAFVGSYDLTGGNPDHNFEVFLVDRATDQVTQITDSTGGGAGNSAVTIDDAGAKVAFIAAADYLGENPDNDDQLFVYTVATETLTQLTDNAGGFTVAEPSLTGDGNRIAFRGDADLTGANADHNHELFRVNADGSGLVQITTTTGSGDLRNPSANQTGNRIAFTSSRNLVPATGNADGNSELFVADPSGPSIVQLSQSLAVTNTSPDINAAGTQVVFASQNDPTGGNPDGNFEIFRRSVTSTQTSQLTDTIAGANTTPTTDADGTRVVFGSDSVDHPRADDGTRNVYTAEVGQAGVLPVITASGLLHSDNPVISGDGRMIVFSSKANPLRSNKDAFLYFYQAGCGPRGSSFTDVAASSAASGPIEWINSENILKGAGGRFRPKDPVQRQQMARVLYRLADRPAFTPPVTPTFGDVPPSNSFYAEIEWAVDEGLMTGSGPGTFRPRNTVKRQQVARSLYALAGDPLFVTPGTATFSDVPPSSPSFLAIEWLVDEGITEGFRDGTFRPANEVKRQQLAVMAHAFMVSPGVNLAG